MINRKTIGQRVSGRHLFLCRMAGDVKGASILDLGCGFGWFEAFAINAGCSRIVGLDTDEVSLKRAARETTGPEFLLYDALNAPENMGEFDIVVMFDFLEHVPAGDESLLLEKVRGFLKPDGRLLISTPHRGLVSTLLDPAFYLGHRHYKSTEIERLLGGAYFKIQRVAYAGGVWEQISMIWLYIFKWFFGREMPFEAFLEKRRAREYEDSRPKPGRLKACVTMFVEATRLAD